jgi:hypothetical protein
VKGINFMFVVIKPAKGTAQHAVGACNKYFQNGIKEKVVLLSSNNGQMVRFFSANSILCISL